MKTIQLSDEDFNDLMELARELREQEHDGNRSPVFWEPRSSHQVPDVNEEGTPVIYDNDGVEQYSLKGWYEYNKENETTLYEEYLLYFKSDVQNFIKSNKHHLGENPHTYANTVWRMPKMERLITIICKVGSNER